MSTISNEAIVQRIQDGDAELLGQLWERVKRFVVFRANAYIRLFYGQRGETVDVNDLTQTGYIAFRECVENYKVDGGKVFTSYLDYYLRNHWRRLYGIDGKTDALDNAKSLDIPVDDDGDLLLIDTIPDPKSEAEFEKKETEIYCEHLHTALDDALAHAPNGDIVRRRYFNGETATEIANDLGITTAEARRREQKAFRFLRHSPYTPKLKEFDYYHGTGLRAFKDTGMSVQERYVLKP